MNDAALTLDFRPPIARFSVSDGEVAVTEESRETLLRDLDDRLSADRGFAVATLNLDHLVKLHRDPAFRSAYAAHTHVTADGNPIVWLARLMGLRLDLVTGSDMIEPLLSIAAARGTPVAFFGSTQPTLDAAAHVLTFRFPGLRIVSCLAPSGTFEPDTAEAGEALAALQRSFAAARRPGEGALCLVALGAPKQERFAARGRDTLPNVGFLSIGAGLDFVTGKQRRAPAWVRRLALEWLWRLTNNPRRLARRYLDCLLILPGAAADAMRRRARHARARHA